MIRIRLIGRISSDFRNTLKGSSETHSGWARGAAIANPAGARNGGALLREGTRGQADRRIRN